MSIPLVGNSNVKSSVESIFKSGKIPHALIIEGEAGLGKKTLCSYIAKALVCDSDTPPCDNCRQCHLSDTNSHPDIFYVSPEDGKKEISVKQIRDFIIPQSVVSKHLSRRKVFIITPANRMRTEAQNAFLKILEEPPENIIFILLTVSRAALLETVLSRCVTLSLSTPSFEEGFNLLKDRYESEAVKKALKESGNNIGLAISFLNKNKDNPLYALAEEFIESYLSGKEYKCLQILNKGFKDRVTADEFLSTLETTVTFRAKNSLKNPSELKSLHGFYEKIAEYKSLLKTNINLSLLASEISIQR